MPLRLLHTLFARPRARDDADALEMLREVRDLAGVVERGGRVDPVRLREIERKLAPTWEETLAVRRRVGAAAG